MLLLQPNVEHFIVLFSPPRKFKKEIVQFKLLFFYNYLIWCTFKNTTFEEHILIDYILQEELKIMQHFFTNVYIWYDLSMFIR